MNKRADPEGADRQPGPGLLRRAAAEAERQLVDRNVYWLSTQPDAVNWNKTLGQPQGTHLQYANLRRCRRCRSRAVSATAAPPASPGPTARDLATTVTITNTSASTVAFLLRADVRRGTASGQELAGDNELQSSIWQGNDITLFPGESQTLTVTYNSADLHGATPVISMSRAGTSRNCIS